MKTGNLRIPQVLGIVLILTCLGFSQTLTIGEIMAEPSIAGLRVEGEKLSPDGKSVIYLWNAEGKMPRDLYLSSTERNDAKILLRVSDMPKPTASPTPENKLDYGLIVRDEFVTSRANQLGNFEWSPDSKKLLFSHGGDLYVLKVVEPLSAEQKNAKWNVFETSLRQRSAIVKRLVSALESAAVDPSNTTPLKQQQKDLDVSMQSGGQWDSQRLIVLQIARKLWSTINRLNTSPPDQLKSTAGFPELLAELNEVQKSVNIAGTDYEESVQPAKPKRYTKTQASESGARFLDNERIVFQQTGHLYVLNTVDASLIQLTKEANPQTSISVSGGTPNKAGTLIAYVVSDASKQKALFVPNYLDEFTAAPSVRRGWSEQKLFVVPTDGSRDAPFEIKLPKAEGVSNFRRMLWTTDGRSLIVDRNDKDTKRRQLFYIHDVGSKGEQTILVTEETDDKWQAPLSVIFEPNPKNSGELFFASERDGYSHLYLAKLTPNRAEPNPTGEIRSDGDPGFSSNVTIGQLTKGNWQVEWAKWTADGDQIVYSSTKENTAERQFYSLYPAGGEELLITSSAKGMRSSPQMDDQNAQPTLLFSFSQWNRPDDLYAQKICPKCGNIYVPKQLTNTMPDAFTKRTWNEPKFIDIPSRDGKIIKTKIYLPAGHTAKQKYPMAIFVHGAGYLQNTINGWNNYYREFMFNQLLTQKGYVVLDIDYRGSAGYGRDWRTDVYDFLGGKDYDDHIDSIDYMVKNYAVDQKRIGVYGGSYGGFMAGMLVTRAPDRIAAAAALRSVFDWKNYYASSPQYTAQRLGFPDKNHEAYKRSSPITYADKLERPLLILHGMSDDNVHVQDSVQMIEKLIRLGKTPFFEAMLYPSENHGFVRPDSWTDEYTRILNFFEKHLKP